MIDLTPPPIEVAATPVKPQIEAGIRQAALAIGTILGAFGVTGLAAKANLVVSLAPEFAILLSIIGPALAAAAAYVGQIATRRHAQNAAAMAAQLPDQVARFK